VKIVLAHCLRSTLKGVGVLVFLLVCTSVWPQEALCMRIVSASMSRGVSGDGTDPVDITDRFQPDSPSIHAVLVLEGAKAGTKVRGTWVSVDAIETPNHKIDSSEVLVKAHGDARVHFQISKPQKGWPVGNYRLDVSVAGKFVTSIPFSVESAPTLAQAPTPSSEKKSKGLRAPQASGASDGLLGRWKCSNAYGVASLEFQAGNRLVYEGESMTYKQGPGVLSVQEEDGPAEYRYALKGDVLQIVFPEGDRMECRRVLAPEGTPRGGIDSTVGSSSPVPGQPSGGGSGSTHALQGWFCSYGGSSGSSSSYSRSTRVFFDGQGGFSYSQESSFSSGAGLAYGSRGGGANSGRYRVEGNRVVLTFGDGSSGVANVYNRAGNGRITELMYNGQLYAPQLCD